MTTSIKAAPVQEIEHCIWARNGNTPCPHTAAQRQWVGLSDGEISEAVERAIQGHAGQRAALSWAIRHVSAKLRELNGGAT